jgi:hypothetical protein
MMSFMTRETATLASKHGFGASVFARNGCGPRDVGTPRGKARTTAAVSMPGAYNSGDPDSM